MSYSYEGKQLAVKNDVGGCAMTRVNYTYAAVSGMPYSSSLGTATTSGHGQSNDLPLTTLSPLLRRETIHNGDNYFDQVHGFDGFARPLSVDRVSPWYSDIELTEYADNTSL